MTLMVAAIVGLLVTGTPGRAPLLAPGLYVRSAHTVFVGVEHSLPGPAGNDFFDPTSHETGDLPSTVGLNLRAGVLEERRTIDATQGRLGASLYYAGEKPRSTVILIHGNDPETREMGFIIPFFVLNGINVISYDQRGVGESTGNWFLNGPAQKADDAAAIYDAFRDDAHVDPRRIGVWGFSNGGWTAPLMPLRRPIAFVLLKSAATESLARNIDYEIDQELLRHGVPVDARQKALALWHAIKDSLDGARPWSEARRMYSADAQSLWFQYSLIPDIFTTIPPSSATAAGLRRATTFDPTGTLSRLTVPTLALYGARDRRVDSADSATHMRLYLSRAGNRDATIQMYANASHQLLVSKDGFTPDSPERYVPGYPQMMITWLAKRGFTSEAARQTP
jgi:pimeloyl-ACP methyl ester carboxylesterase